MQRGEEPALTPFLQLLDDHISAHPELLQPMTTDLAAHLDDLVGAIDVDLNAPLETDGEEDKDCASLWPPPDDQWVEHVRPSPVS
ncbi:MAG: type II toxin-antitoxin system PrlF family antitoxin [Cyanobacteria bacterium MAG CAR2_bin_4]|nr:type II toxin-antitoxin system PrlF family antitoxin [Cyanobacteria bacterium MAG CAR2_bin_4]